MSVIIAMKVVLLLLIYEVSIALSATTGVLRFATNIKYKDNNLVIGRQSTDGTVDLGDWSPTCQFTPRNDFAGRVLLRHCDNATGEWEIEICLKNPTAEDQNGTYVCGDGSLLPLARIECTASYRTVDNSGASLDKHSGLVVLMVVLALYVMIGA